MVRHFPFPAKCFDFRSRCWVLRTSNRKTVAAYDVEEQRQIRFQDKHPTPGPFVYLAGRGCSGLRLKIALEHSELNRLGARQSAS